MTSPPPARPPDETSPRVLALASSASARRLADLLASWGHEVRTARTPAEMEKLLHEGDYDALLLEVSQGRPKHAALERIARALASLTGKELRRPSVLALAPSGSGPLEGPPAIAVDAWLVTADADRVRRQVEAAAAARRLSAARGEIARLRDTVRHARSTAHDLAQPLTTIMARAQLLLSRTPAEDPSHRPLSVICQEADRLASLIERFQALKTMAAAQGGSSRE